MLKSQPFSYFHRKDTVALMFEKSILHATYTSHYLSHLHSYHTASSVVATTRSSLFAPVPRRRVHTCMHTYMYAYIHTHIHTYIHTYIHACMHTYMHTCIHAYTHTYIHIHAHTYIYIRTHVYYINLHIHTCIHTRTHTCIHIVLVFAPVRSRTC
jgi:hypothetical protein